MMRSVTSYKITQQQGRQDAVVTLPLTELTLSLDAEPLLKDGFLQQDVQGTRQGTRVLMCGAQLLFKLKHLIHQVAEESIIIQKPRSIQGQLLLSKKEEAPTQFHLNQTGVSIVTKLVLDKKY